MRLTEVHFKVALTWLGFALSPWLAVGAVLAADSSSLPAAFSHEQINFYETKVKPILSENCFKCHSHQAEKIKGSLVIDSREGALKGGDSGPAILPGDPEKSLLIRAVRHVDEDLQMPPKKKLAEAQIALLTEWIMIG